MTSMIRRSDPVLIWDSLFRDFFNNTDSIIDKSTQGYPVTDITVDKDENQVVEMALAGFSKENLKIEVKDNAITVKGESKVKEGDEGYLKTKRIAARAFCKTFVDYDNKLDLLNSDVKFENGLLTIIIPHLPEAKSKL